MKWPRFLTFKANECIYILQSAFPHYLGKVMRYDNDWTLDHAPGEPKCRIEGYRIVVFFGGALQGNRVWGETAPAQLQQLINEMAGFYFSERICADEKRFRRWKV